MNNPLNPINLFWRNSKIVFAGIIAFAFFDLAAAQGP